MLFLESDLCQIAWNSFTTLFDLGQWGKSHHEWKSNAKEGLVEGQCVVILAIVYFSDPHIKIPSSSLSLILTCVKQLRKNPSGRDVEINSLLG